MTRGLPPLTMVAVMGLRDRWRKPTPEDAFADEVAAVFQELVPAQHVERAPEFALRITMSDGTVATMFLQNIYAEALRLEGEERTERLRRAVLAMAPPDRPRSWEDARGRLMPAVRSASWAAGATSADIVPIRRVFAPFLFLLTVVDDPHGMSFVSEEDAGRWGVDPEAIRQEAIANLCAAEVPVAMSDDDRVVEILGPDGYASSWLAVPPALTQFAQRAEDEFVVVAKSRDSLLLLASDDRDLLRKDLEQLLDEYQSEPRQLSPVPYEVRDATLVPWDPPPDDPCRVIVDLAGGALAATEYQHQHDVLSELFTRTGEDVFVANYNLMQREDQTVWSWSAWVKEITDGLLPRTDYVALTEHESQDMCIVTWESFLGLAGDLICEEPGYYPARWRVSGCLPDETFSALQRVAVDPGG